MHPKQLMAYTGVALVIIGVLMVAQFVWPDHFQNVQKALDIGSMSLKTTVAGFGVLIVGALLLVLATIKLPQFTITQSKQRRRHFRCAVLRGRRLAPDQLGYPAVVLQAVLDRVEH